jgi:hypothetical protein
VGAQVIATQEITLGLTSQSLVFDCPDGRPSAVTSVTVYEADADDTATAEAATTGSAAVDTNPNTTLSVAAGVGDQSITVTSATGFVVDRRYFLTAAAGHREEIEVAGITGSVLTLRHPLINAYLITTSTVVTGRCTISVDNTWAADVANLSPALTPNARYRVRWLVTLGGVAQVYDRYLDVVRYPARHNVSPLDVDRRFPGWLDGLPVDYREDQGRALIDRAWQALKEDLRQDGKADQAMRNSEMVAELVITRAMLLRNEDAFLAGAIDAPRLEAARELYTRRYDAAIRSPVAPMDTTGGGGATSNRPTPIGRR